jgi:hypothetical protein
MSRPAHIWRGGPGVQHGEDLRGPDRLVLYEWLTDEEIDVLLGLARQDRDKFLIQLLSQTDMRIGKRSGSADRTCTCCPILGC